MSAATGAGVRVELYGKRDCGLCEEAKAVLERVRRDLPFDLVAAMRRPAP